MRYIQYVQMTVEGEIKFITHSFHILTNTIRYWFNLSEYSASLVTSVIFKNLKSFKCVISDHLLDLFEVIFLMKFFKNIRKLLLSVSVNENRHRLYGISVLPVGIESNLAVFKIRAVIASVKALFSAACSIGTGVIRIHRRIGTGIVTGSARSTPGHQETVIAGKSAIGDWINPFSCLFAQSVFDPAHCLDMHDPVPAERHPHKSPDVLAAPVVNQS